MSNGSGGAGHRRICARCGSPAVVRHLCRAVSPARAAVAVDLELPDDARLEDLYRLLVGAPYELERVFAALPSRRRDRILYQLRDERDQAHDQPEAA